MHMAINYIMYTLLHPVLFYIIKNLNNNFSEEKVLEY